MHSSFEELVSRAQQAPTDGWDFSWLAGRAVTEPCPWDYRAELARRLARASAALDLLTGGGEILSAVPALPPVMAATEGWPPNVGLATRRLHARGAVVVVNDGEQPLPFADDAFDLVVSRHPSATDWTEIARVLRPGGTYLSQHVLPTGSVGLPRFFRGGPLHHPADRQVLEEELNDYLTDAEKAMRAAGLEPVDLQGACLRGEFADVGAVVYYLRKVVWMVPGFSVDAHRDRLRELHEHIEAHGPATNRLGRLLIEARKPAGTDDGASRSSARG
ncbi:class I SAM-dependent methyltransferase [Spirillospora sp. NPDC127200]